MTRPRCGATNREDAAYCDSCGAPIGPGAGRPTRGSRDGGADGLVAWMTVDWLLRFAIVGIVGIVAAIVAATAGVYDYATFFLLLGIVGCAGTWYILRHNPVGD